MTTTDQQQQQVVMTVTNLVPVIEVTADAADTGAPALTLDGATYELFDRVQVTIRTPLRPLITGKVT